MHQVWSSDVPFAGDGAYIDTEEDNTATLQYFCDGNLVDIMPFPNVPITFQSPLVNYENLCFRGGFGDCSWEYNRDDEFYRLLGRVVNGQKAVANLGSFFRCRECHYWAARAENAGLDYIEQDMHGYWFLTIFPRNATLNTLFGRNNLRNLEADYERAGIRVQLGEHVDRKIISFLPNLHNARQGTVLDKVVAGLLYGYPIESTMSFILQ